MGRAACDPYALKQNRRAENQRAVRRILKRVQQPFRCDLDDRFGEDFGNVFSGSAGRLFIAAVGSPL